MRVTFIALGPIVGCLGVLACGGTSAGVPAATSDASVLGDSAPGTDDGGEGAATDGAAPDAAAPDGSGVASTAQMVLMSPVKTSLGPRGAELVAMNLDGSNRLQLTDNELMEFLPHFSPDATRVVYTLFTTGSYGEPGATTEIAVYDFATAKSTTLTTGGNNSQGIWSPDGTRIAYGMASAGTNALWMMNADGSSIHEVGHPSGADDDFVWGDPAWSADDWILFVVAQRINGCFKTRVDKIRPDGSARTQVSDGGPNCTPQGMEQNGEADPGWSADGKTVYSSRGFPAEPAGAPDAGAKLTERKLYAFSSEAWYAGKPESDLSLPSEPSCIEGVPKGSPDGTRILLYRACFDSPSSKPGIYVTDTAGSYRTFIAADGFGPDWNPVAK